LSMMAPVAAVRPVTGVKVPRRVAWRGDGGEAFREAGPGAAGRRDGQGGALVVRTGRPGADLGVVRAACGPPRATGGSLPGRAAGGRHR
jgi:hypothetical protein